MSRRGHNRNMKFGRYDYAAFQSFFAYASGTVVLPVALVALSRDLGFDLSEGGMTAGGALHFGRTCFVMLSMLFLRLLRGPLGKTPHAGRRRFPDGAGRPALRLGTGLRNFVSRATGYRAGRRRC